jgi:Putative zinc-finger
LNPMKHSDSTEMDRLLRRHARRSGETLRATRGAQDDTMAEANIGAHLDADEMNAYAEGALPEASRSRYFAHLADCDSCRKLVTELTLAASREDEGKTRVASLAATPSKSWRERLAAIFSPPVLRYGVPALALFAVIVVAIVALRTNRRESGVALNTTQQRYSAPSAPINSDSAADTTTATGTAGSHSNSNAAPFMEEQIMDEQSRTQPAPAATPPLPKPSPVEDNAPVVSQDRLPRSETAPADDSKNSSGEFGVLAKREQAEVTAASPPPPAPQQSTTAAPVANEADARDRREEQKKNKIAGKDDMNEVIVGGRKAGETVANQRVDNQPRAEVGKTTAARASQSERRRPAPAAKSGPAATDMVREREDSAETRNVGGRRFRRQGNAWVDTAYNSSRPTTSVARGSEQYRALVADEPPLRTIAERLGGEVFVVWKNRAYRFY